MTSTRSGEIRFWFRAAGAVFVVSALVAFFTGFFRAQYYRATGEAQWIWAATKLSSGAPLAFFAVKEFEVPLNPPFVRIKIACDPEYTLYFNGEVVGRALEGSTSSLDVYDVTPLARQGEPNRIVVAARSANGVGGLIVAVDYAPIRENDVVSDGGWKLYAAWRDELVHRDLDLPALPVRVLGKPPFGRWNDLTPVSRPRLAWSEARLAPVDRRAVSIPVARIRVVGGVAVATREIEPATAWDFGDFQGRCVVTGSPAGSRETRVVRIRVEPRFDDFRLDGAVREVALAPGETSYVDPRLVRGRWVALYGADANPSIIPDDRAAEEEMPGD